MQGSVTPTFSFLGEFFGALNEARPRADVDPCTFAPSHVSGLDYQIGSEIKIKGIPKPVKQALGAAGIKTSEKFEIEIIPSQGSFKNGTKQGFDDLRHILHLPQ